MEKFGIECKQLMAKEIKERLKTSSTLFVTSFEKMTVPEQEELRSKLKEIDASLFVVKNRIAKQVFQQLNSNSLSSLMKGLTTLTLGGPDPVSVSKALVEFAGKHKSFAILGAYVDERLLDVASVTQLASIPSREVLLTQIVMGLKSPIQGLVTSLSATIKKFVLVIDRIREKQSEE